MWSCFLLEKLKIAELLLGKEGAQLFRAIYPNGTPARTIRKMAGRYYKWQQKRSPRTNDQQLFDNLCVALKFKGEPLFMMTCDMEEFRERLSEIDRAILEEAKQIPGTTDVALSAIHLDPYYNYERLYASFDRAFFKHDQLDQRFLYMGADSVRRWKDMITGGKYRTHDQCVAALSNLLGSVKWKDLFYSGSYDAIVDLGAGTAGKTKRMIEDYVERTAGNLKVSVVDTSLYMLDAAATTLAPVVSQYSERLAYAGYSSDFSDLRGISEKLKGKKNVCYLLLGSTFANTQERTLLQSLRRQADPGDLFVVGVEFFDLAIEGEEKDAILNQFRDENLSALALSAIRLLPKMHHVTGLNSAVKPVVSEPEEFSEIPGVRAIKLELPLGGRKVLVAYSNRYSDKAFEDFVESNWFDYLFDEVSPLNPRYKLKVFRRTTRKNSA
jgi:hypothetical protein